MRRLKRALILRDNSLAQRKKTRFSTNVATSNLEPRILKYGQTNRWSMKTERSRHPPRKSSRLACSFCTLQCRIRVP